MAIVNVQIGVTGQSNFPVNQIDLTVTDVLADCLVPGYLNQLKNQGYALANNMLAHVYGPDFQNGGPGVLDFQVYANPQTGVYSLTNMSASGEVDLPVNTNHIAVFVNSDGVIGDDAATAINGGNIQAGLSGTAGKLTSYPATASKGSLNLVAVANTGNTATTISNLAMGQASVISIPDPAGATADFVIAPAALVNGNLVKASGTAGLVVDAGVAPAAIQLSANIKSAVTANIGGAGAGPISVSVAGMTTSSVVACTIASSSNAVQVQKAISISGGFNVTFSGDPGASCLLNYVAFIAAQ